MLQSKGVLYTSTFVNYFLSGDSASKGAFSGLSQLVKNKETNEEDELLDLCSGRFTGTGTQQKENSEKSGGFAPSTQDDRDELLDLCSGKFTGSAR